jgi:organic radical activating enzyme
MFDSHVCVKINGTYAPCCVYQNQSRVMTVDNSIQDYLESDIYKTIKENMDNGWDPGCNSCKVHEEKGIQSHRDRANNSSLASQGLEYLELNVSNECNIACRTCGPHASSKWEQLVGLQEPSSEKNLDNIFSNTDISKLRLIKFLGGEPFITPTINTLFDYLEQKELIEKIEFLTLTNCTYFPKKYESILNRFTKLSVALSIDGFNKSTEYGRTGTDWEELKEVMHKWIDFRNNHHNMDLYIHTTVSALTVHDYSNLCKFAEENSLRISEYLIQAPEYLRIDALPEEYKESIIDNNNSKFFVNYNFDQTLFDTLKFETKQKDALLKQNMQDYIPNLYDYLR